MKKQLSFNCVIKNFKSTHEALTKGSKIITDLEKLGIDVEYINICDQYEQAGVSEDGLASINMTATEAVVTEAPKKVEEAEEAPVEVVKKKAAPKKAKAAKIEKSAPAFEMPEPLEANMSNAEQIAWIKQLNSSIEAKNCSSNDVSVCLRLHAAVHDIKVTKALLSKMGYEKPSEIPEEKAASFIALFFDNVIRPDVDADACSDEEEDF